jgi:FkbM family methyltransferase
LKELLREQPHLKERIGIVKQELINSYIDNSEGHLWSENDFIAHQVFCEQAKGCTEKFTSLVKKVTPHFSSYTNITRNDRGPSFVYKQHSDRELEPTRCAALLQQHRAGQIDQTKSLTHSKSYVTRSNTKHTFQISVHSESVDGMRFSIFKSGLYYEHIMTDVISSIMKESEEKSVAAPVMLDVGANVGWFSLLAASYGAEVFAFEPNVINMVRFCESQLLNGWSLAQNLESYNRIHSYLKGVGLNHGERLSMFTPDPNNPGAHTFNIQTAKGQFARRGKNNAQLQQLEGGELPIVTLDALAKDQGWLSGSRDKSMKITLMKMDIEGAEHAALGGSKKLLCAHIIENILIEFNADLSRAEWISQLKILFDCGYKVYKFGGHTGPNKDLTLSSEDPEEVVDFIRNFNYGVKDSNVNVWLKVD